MWKGYGEPGIVYALCLSGREASNFDYEALHHAETVTCRHDFPRMMLYSVEIFTPNSRRPVPVSPHAVATSFAAPFPRSGSHRGGPSRRACGPTGTCAICSRCSSRTLGCWHAVAAVPVPMVDLHPLRPFPEERPRDNRVGVHCPFAPLTAQGNPGIGRAVEGEHSSVPCRRPGCKLLMRPTLLTS